MRFSWRRNRRFCLSMLKKRLPGADKVLLHALTKSSGFSLLELLIALTIFAIGLLSISGMQITAIRGNSTANRLTQTSALAQSVLENMLARSTTDPLFNATLSDQDWDFDPSSSVDKSWPLGGGPYSAKYSIDIDTPVTNVAKVTVTVKGPQNRSITLSGLKRTK